jgi:integrase/recombinase XerC
VKFQQALTLFLQVDRAEQTRDTYRKFLNRLAAWAGPDRPLDRVHPEDLDAYVYEMRHRPTRYAGHPKRPEENGPLSTTTLYKNVKMIKTFFRWCVARGYLEADPSRFLGNSRPVRPLGQGRAATDEELELLLAGAQFAPRDRAIVLLLAQSGCRAGEAARLRIQDLALGDGQAVVDGKGDKRRTIYFGLEAAAALRAWLAVRPPVSHVCVFTSTRGGGPLSARSLSQVVRRLGARVGLERSLGAHSLRHRVGQTFARQHVPVRVAQVYLGHARPEITFGYYQDVDEELLREAGRLLATELPPGSAEELREKKKADAIRERFRRQA